MMKYLAILFTTVIFATGFAKSDNNENPKKVKTFEVEITDQGQEFLLDAKTVQDMPNAIGLEIGTLNIMAPKGRAPGVIALSLRPAGDVGIDMVGPQQGSFTFSKSDGEKALPQNLPLGRYLLLINGEAYGMLVVSKDKVMLRYPQMKSQPAEAGSE